MGTVQLQMSLLPRYLPSMWNGIKNYKAGLNNHALVASGFKLNLDSEHNYKPRSSRSTNKVKDFMDEFNFDVAGEEMRMPMWKRPHHPKSAAGWITFFTVRDWLKRAFMSRWPTYYTY